MRQAVYTRQYADWSRVPLLLKTDEACALLRITENTLKVLIKDNAIKGKKFGREWRIEKESIKSYINGE